jgi:hypothetical protein
MKKFLLGLAAIPLLAGPAFAAQPLTNNQMDLVTAGFSAFSTADAQALGKIVATLSSTVSQVSVVTTAGAAGPIPVSATFGETTLQLIKSISGSQSASSATNTLPTVPSGLSPNGGGGGAAAAGG